MGKRSSIEQLPDPILEAVHDAIKRGETYDDIVDLITSMGEERSRSAVGRYSKQYREMADRQRDIDNVAKSFAADFGDPDNPQLKLLIQLFTSVLTQAVIPMASGEDKDIDGREMHFYARSIKDIAGAAKTDTDRELKIREEERKATLREATDAAVGAARGSGADAKTIEAIKRDLLNLNQDGDAQ